MKIAQQIKATLFFTSLLYIEMPLKVCKLYLHLAFVAFVSTINILTHKRAKTFPNYSLLNPCIQEKTQRKSGSQEVTHFLDTNQLFHITDIK